MMNSVPIFASPLAWIDDKIDLSTFSDRRYASGFNSLLQETGPGMGKKPTLCLPGSRSDKSRLPLSFQHYNC